MRRSLILPAWLLLSLAGAPAPAHSAMNRLQLAISHGDVEETRRLLEAGADPNAKGGDGGPISKWLGSGQRYSDDSLLEVTKLLEEHRCRFEPSVILNLAHRRVPKTLAFLASRQVEGDYNRALKAISRGDDLASIKTLLDAGADPLEGAALSSPLMDAAMLGKTPTVTMMLKRVKDLRAEKVLAAYKSAVKSGRTGTVKAFVDAGVKPPAPPAPGRPSPCRPRELSGTQRALMSRLGLPNTAGLIGLAGEMRCRLMQECGDLILVDCNSAADGPAYYLDQKNGKRLSTCGGACMGGCKDECPPKAWTCECRL